METEGVLVYVGRFYEGTIGRKRRAAQGVPTNVGEGKKLHSASHGKKGPGRKENSSPETPSDRRIRGQRQE